MAFTVTATMGGTAANEHIYLWIRVLTGATEAGGASAGGIAATGGTTVEGSLTPSFSHGLPCFAITADNWGGTYTAAANNTIDSQSADPDTWGAGFGRYTGTVTAGTPLTFGASGVNGSCDYGTWACYEIQPSAAGVTPAVDASSPALASATGAGVKTVTSASFTPPAGSVIAAMVCGGGSGSSGSFTMSVTDTSGLGLTWTQRAAGGATVTDQDTFVFTTTVPGGGNSGAPPLRRMNVSGSVTVPAAVWGIGTPVNATGASGSVTGSWPTGSSQTAGNLLVAVVTAGGTTSAASISTPSGWAKQIEEGNSATAHAIAAIYTKTAAGGDAAPTFTSTESGTAGGMDCLLLELGGANTSSPIDKSGVFASGSSTSTLASTTFTVTTSASVTAAGGYGIAVFAQERTAGNLTFTDAGTGWTKLVNGVGASRNTQAAILVQPAVPTGSTLNDHGAFSTTTSAFGAAIVAVVGVAPPGSTTATGSAALRRMGTSGFAFGPTATAGSLALRRMGTAGSASVPLPVITGLAGTGAGYFVDGNGNPRMVLGDAVWALPGNAGRWSSGDWQGDFDTYLATRAAQGFTVVYCKPIGTTQSGNLDNFGKTFDSLYPFQGTAPTTGQSGANPSTGLTAAFWARIDYFLNSALAKGITVFLNAIGYSSDFDSGPGPLAGKSTTEFTAYGTALGGRYASQANLIWLVADDYFSDLDSVITAFLTGLRGAGDSHAISIENMPESDSRNTFDSTPTVLPWGTSNAGFNFCYSYNRTYFGIERAFAESSPICPVQGDGYFYQGGSTYSSTFDRAIRQDAWHAISSGARGIIHGDEACWQWQSTAQASAAANWYQVHNAGNIRTLIESLPGWHLLAPDASSQLVTAGRGTHAGAFASGGSGGQYEPAFTDSYVTASRAPDSGSGSGLAVIYLSHATTITIDQAKMAPGYQAFWADPVTGAKTATTAGSTYNSATPGSNSQGDPDWVLILQATACSGSVALPPMGVAGAASGAAGGVTCSGSPALAPMAQSAAATQRFTASGDLSLPALAVSGQGVQAHASSGSAALAPMALSGQGTQVFTAPGSVALPPMAQGGQVGQAIPASGSLALPPLAQAGSSTAVAAGSASGALALPAMGASGTAESFGCSGGLALAPMGGGAAAAQVITAAGSLPLAPVGVSASGVEVPAGSAFGSMALPAMGQAGSAESLGFSAAPALAPMGLSGTAAIASASTASGGLTLAPMGTSGAVGQESQASGSLALAVMGTAGEPPAVSGTVRAAQMALARVQQGQAATARTGQGQMTLAHAQGGQWP